MTSQNQSFPPSSESQSFPQRRDIVPLLEKTAYVFGDIDKIIKDDKTLLSGDAVEALLKAAAYEIQMYRGIIQSFSDAASFIDKKGFNNGTYSNKEESTGGRA